MVNDRVSETLILPETAPVGKAFLDKHRPKEQPTHDRSQRESLFFNYHDTSLRWLKPDLSALRLRNPERIGKGFAFEVYEAQAVDGKDMVVKVERVDDD